MPSCSCLTSCNSQHFTFQLCNTCQPCLANIVELLENRMLRQTGMLCTPGDRPATVERWFAHRPAPLSGLVGRSCSVWCNQDATLGAPGIAARTERSDARNVAPGLTTRNKNATRAMISDSHSPQPRPPPPHSLPHRSTVGTLGLGTHTKPLTARQASERT